MHMKKLTTIILFTFTVISNIAAADSACLLEGRWQSNKEMTLASMNKSGVVTEKQKALFNGDFFGKLTIDATCDRFTSYYEGESDEKAYETLSQNGNTITVRYIDPIEEKPVNTTITITDGCYSLLLENLNFNEYFCKIE
jgi:heat shock protein HslJ